MDQGAWHELVCLLGGKAPPPPNTPEFDAMLVKLFAPDEDGNVPSTFYLARALRWPLLDVLDSPQLVVAPSTDEEIVELLANLPTGSCAPCSPTPLTVVRGFLADFATGMGPGLDGLPLVGMFSALPYVFDIEPPSQGSAAAERLFRAYRPLLANNGIGDELRAVDLVLTESTGFYKLACNLDPRGGDSSGKSELVAMDARPVPTLRTRPMMDVVFAFQNTETGSVQRWFQRVATGGPFPFFVDQQTYPFFEGQPVSVRPQWLTITEPPLVDPPMQAPISSPRPAETWTEPREPASTTTSAAAPPDEHAIDHRAADERRSDPEPEPAET
ncbi:MAG: hypothetical protein AB1Z98_04845 [Nannocystaceae bacterium]